MTSGYITNAYWQQLLPDEIRVWAIEQIVVESELRGDEYISHYRCAEEYDFEQEILFSEIEETGCCGSNRFKRVGPDGKTYVLGYNYGH
jgi:hypothetical protein